VPTIGEGTTPGCLDRSAPAAAAGAAATTAAPAAAVGTYAEGIAAATLMLRATRTRRPARSISISGRLVSSSNSASSRISALSSLLDELSSLLEAGWRAMILIRNFLSGDGGVRQALAWNSVRLLGADLGGKTGYREPIAFDAEARQAGKG